jgi:hypothetical protein
MQQLQPSQNPLDQLHPLNKLPPRRQQRNARMKPRLLCHSVSSSLPFTLVFKPLDASNPIRPPDNVISIGFSTENASASFGLCSKGCVTNKRPYKSVKIDPTKASVSPIPTIRIRRALISSLVYLGTTPRSYLNICWCCHPFVVHADAVETLTI